MSARRGRRRQAGEGSLWPLSTPHWAKRRQRLVDLLGTRAFTRRSRGREPLWIDMAAAGVMLGCSPAAARKRLQRDGETLLRVGGRWLIRRIAVASQLPNFGIGQPVRKLGTAELAKTLRGRGGRLLSTQGVRLWLQRHDLGFKKRGRWWITDLLRVSSEVARQRQSDDYFECVGTSGSCDGD